ncbi:TonB-dependent receptor [Allosphingosinicella vermicomposti]|uniref:TonB-dependent receptor n=1 Tax=Allosphingosinicella vermicomposti TaxID=614671 RepID=UPI00131A5D84|nr:TonB-dependent receptor [Allosphingosinicella vermicomposti]
MTRKRFDHRVAIAALALGLCSATNVGHAQAAQPQQYEFQLGGGSLRDALTVYGRVTGRQLLYPSALVSRRAAPALHGRFTADQALVRLLEGTGIKVHRARNNVYVLKAGRAAQQTRARPVPAPARPERQRQPARPAPPVGDAAPEDETGPEIVVTGTNIRGQREGPSQLLVIGGEDIVRSGYGTVAEALAALPQNFGGTATEDTAITGSDRTIANSTLASSVNLRGLGSDATLTLVNGRRVAGSGGKGDFTDLSSIPTAAVERIEVLADGASALYGSDAVGGVVNLVLRTTIDGGESRARIGTTTSGGVQDYQLSQLLGTTWGSGHILGAYEFQHRENLEARDRPYTRSQDLRPLGGSDHRGYFSNPGTIVALDATGGGFVPVFAIPEDQDGTGLEPGDFQPGANFENLLEGTDVLPRQTRHSLYVTAEQEAGSGVTLFAEGRYAERNFSYRSLPSTALLQVTAANPYFVSPDGSPFSLIAYSFGPELGAIEVEGEVRALSATVGGTFDAGDGWLVDAYLTHAFEESGNRTGNIVQSSYLYEALGIVPDDPITPFSTATDGFFNPYGEGASNSETILDFIGQGFTDERIDNGLTSVNVKADGPLFEIGGGSVRGAIGATYRVESFLRRGEAFYFGAAPDPLDRTDADRSITAAFAELLIPLVSQINRRAGLERLELSLAVRHEEYSDFGSTTNPKLGVVWEPLSGLRLRGTYGTSFRAPAIREIGDPLSVSATQLADASGTPQLVLFLSGGNPDLQPERAHSFTLGAQVEPPSAPGLRVETTFFETRFANRIGQPTFEDILNVLRDDIFSPFVRRVNANDPDDLADVTALINGPGSIVPPSLPPEAFSGIVDGRFVNTAKVVVRGLDAAVHKSFNLGEAQAVVGLNGSYLLDYKRQVTPAAPVAERVDTLGNPVDFRMRATGSVSWRDWGTTVSVNYVDGYRDDVSSPERQVDAWTTFDFQIRYQPRQFIKDLTVSLSVQNLFDATPPFVDRSSGFGYDAGNADPLGRFVALQLIKSW